MSSLARFSFGLLMLPLCGLADTARPKPEFQYQTEGIKVPAAKADEPRVTTFNAQSIQAAAKYLDDGALCWVREKTCVNCHTTGPYMAERPALTALFGKPKDEVRADFVKSIPTKGSAPTERDGVKYYPGANTSVWRSMGLAEWDKHVTGKTSEETDRSLRDMFTRMNEDGSFGSAGEVEVPHITTDFELTLQAARAVAAAPDWLANIKDEELRGRIDTMKSYLRSAKPRNDYDRVLRLQLASYLPDVVSDADKKTAMELLTKKQHDDGGWSLRDMSELEQWHPKISDVVRGIVEGLPDAKHPNSDAFMTAQAIVLLRQSNVPVSDERIQRGLAWLKREQRVSGRWWMDSLYRGNYNYITYIATAEALKALSMCDELKLR